MKSYKNLEEEFKELDGALAYWGDEDLHILIKRWYRKLQKLGENDESSTK